MCTSLQVPAVYKSADADDALTPEDHARPAEQPPAFRPADFKWTLAQRAIRFLAALGAQGRNGADWAAEAAGPLRHLLAGSTALRRMLGCLVPAYSLPACGELWTIRNNYHSSHACTLLVHACVGQARSSSGLSTGL